MIFDAYGSPRVFQSPFRRRTETVAAGKAIVGALLGGPFYYWRKQAPIEAIILFMAELILFVVSNRAISATAIDSTTPSLILWLGSGLLAPVLLPVCYRRKGWTEIPTF
jgi:hypothetical protein